MNKHAECSAKARHCIPLRLLVWSYSCSPFADDIALLASTVTGLQKQYNVWPVAAV